MIRFLLRRLSDQFTSWVCSSSQAWLNSGNLVSSQRLALLCRLPSASAQMTSRDSFTRPRIISELIQFHFPGFSRLTTSVLTASRPLCDQPVRGFTRRFRLTGFFFVWLFVRTIFIVEFFNRSISQLGKAGDLSLANSCATQCTASTPGTQMVL